MNIDGENKGEVELLSKCCKVLRRVGLNRTRGYGEVSCELEVIKNEDDNSNIEDIKDNDFVDYIIELQSQTIISSKGSQSTQTLDYIPGANILGYFASRYLKLNSDIDKHYAHIDDKFRALFLDDDLIFSNAYITLVDSEDNYMDFFCNQEYEHIYLIEDRESNYKGPSAMDHHLKSIILYFYIF